MLALLLFHALARADDPVEARRHFEQATALYNGGDFVLALAEFQAAYEAKPHPTVLRNIAATQERLRQYPDAIHTLERYLREATGRALRVERAAVESQLLAFRNIVGRLEVVVRQQGATIRIDDRAVGRSPLSGPVEVALGRHRVEASLEGHDSAVGEVTVPGGGQARIELEPIARMARLTIDTSAPHATVSVDGAPSKSTPWAGVLTPGRHTVQLRAPGRRPAQVVVDLGPGAERSMVMPLEVGGPQGMLAITTKASGRVTALVDGRPIRAGSGGWVTLDEGIHRVVVGAPDHVDYRQNVPVSANRLTNVQVRLAEDRFYMPPIWGAVAGAATALTGVATGYWGLCALDAANEYQDAETEPDRLGGLYADRERFARAANAAAIATAILGTGTALLLYWSRGKPTSVGEIDVSTIR